MMNHHYQIYEGFGAVASEPANDNTIGKPDALNSYLYNLGGKVDAELATTTFAELHRLGLAEVASYPRRRKRLVIIESPYAGATPEDTARNVEYARRCLLDSLMRGEAPIASHLLYTQALDDNKPEERMLGIEAGVAWRIAADASVAYTDFGISAGMRYGINAAHSSCMHVEFRTIGAGE